MVSRNILYRCWDDSSGQVSKSCVLRQATGQLAVNDPTSGPLYRAHPSSPRLFPGLQVIIVTNSGTWATVGKQGGNGDETFLLHASNLPKALRANVVSLSEVSSHHSTTFPNKRHQLIAKPSRMVLTYTSVTGLKRKILRTKNNHAA